MKKIISFLVMIVLVLSMVTVAFAEADMKDFYFEMNGASAADSIFYESSQTATKYGSNYKYGSVRVQNWNGYKPNKNLYVGLNFQGYLPACTFVWMNVSQALSIRVTPELNDSSKTGSSYKYCAAMRLNTVETAATVKASGIFTPDGK